MTFVLVAIAAYILGSIPFGLLIAKQFGLGDIREIGSGNIGTTNVLRAGSKTAAALTLLLDAGKGALAVLIARAVFGEQAAGIAALFAMLGHIFPVFLRFKGGKGVATFLGALLALSFPAGVGACAIWLGVAVMLRVSSMSAILAVLLAPGLTAIFYHKHGALVVGLMSVLVLIKHQPNIKRLLEGNEPKIGEK